MSRCTVGHLLCSVAASRIFVISSAASIPTTVNVSSGSWRPKGVCERRTDTTLCRLRCRNGAHARSRRPDAPRSTLTRNAKVTAPQPTTTPSSTKNRSSSWPMILQLMMSSATSPGNDSTSMVANSPSVMPRWSRAPSSSSPHWAQNQEEWKRQKPSMMRMVDSFESTVLTTAMPVVNAQNASMPWSTMAPSGEDWPVILACLPSTVSVVM
mmetsp:Transcript_12314/g.25531  ORF Transcript_12314/g.25531 Transcript_12314/m.25531 type:complete len:211 (+) Transcript_12314:150-782(+)